MAAAAATVRLRLQRNSGDSHAHNETKDEWATTRSVLSLRTYAAARHDNRSREILRVLGGGKRRTAESGAAFSGKMGGGRGRREADAHAHRAPPPRATVALRDLWTGGSGAGS